MKLLAIIPAKGQSTRLPRKNVMDFCGKPMIHYTVEAALGASIFDRVIVSTEDDEIAQSVSSFSGLHVVKRPENLAVDPATVLDVCNHALDSVDENYDYVFMMLPSTPMRSVKDVLAVNELIQDKSPEGVMSVTHFPYPLSFAYALDDRNRLKKSFPDMTKEEASRKVVDNGGIYALKQHHLKENTICPDGTIAYVMPFWASIDIDTYEDMEIAKAMHSHFVEGK